MLPVGGGALSDVVVGGQCLILCPWPPATDHYLKEVVTMSAHPLEKVIELWRLDKLTQEQVIGQILLLLQEIHERLGDLERRQSESRRGDEEVKRA